MQQPLTIIQVGNFGPPHSTENHLRRALEGNGHTVIAMQENDPATFLDLSDRHTWPVQQPAFILWTRTGWDWGQVFANKGSGERLALGLQRAMLQQASDAKVPVVGYHLDLWFGLNREHQLAEPFFESDIVITADGGHQTEFADLNINHVWFPPGVSRAECESGIFRDKFYSPLAFVGSWQGHYHKEHQHRFELVQWLRRNFRDSCEFYPKVGEDAVRGADLRDLYASVEVVVGDSCLAGAGIRAYVSDRLPETTGRGAYLLHPNIEGVTDGTTWNNAPMWTGGIHLDTWDAGDWDALGARVDWALTYPGERQAIARAGRELVIEHHTYERRTQQLVERLSESDLLRA